MSSAERIAASRLPYKFAATKPGESLRALDDQSIFEIKSRLLDIGAVLLRGFDAGGLEGFRDFVREFSHRELFGYAGGASPRSQLGPSGMYNSTEYPPEMQIPLHNELSYSRVYPEYLYFLCVVAPSGGGETILGDSRRILARIDASVVDEFRSRGVCYLRNLSPDIGTGYSWQEAFETDEPERVERICRARGADFSWLPDGSLRLKQTGPATTIHPLTCEEVWFNQAAGFYNDMKEYGQPARLDCTFGDGGEIPRETIGHIRAALDRESIPHHWVEGDIVVVDNRLAAHGRKPFSGDRRIVLAMT